MTKQWALLAMILLCSHCITCAPNPPIKAVNLGGWLVTEGWITPSLFDGIPNKDFLDGTRIQFKSVTTGKYLSAENGGGSAIVANRIDASDWETFKVWRKDADNFWLRVSDGRFIGLQNGRFGDAVFATTNAPPGDSEIVQIVRNTNNPNLARIRASNGKYWRANSETSVMAEALGKGDWGDGDRSVFILNFVGDQMKGEYQVTNGYGADASEHMNKHWSTFITEQDFKDIASKGLNAVRIPVGWWIASDPNPPLPFVGGSQAALDNAFTWAQNYGLGVIIDLHAAPGGQNPDDHSGTRDGIQSWGEGDTVQQTVDVIRHLSERYAAKSALLGVELMNEPRAPGVKLSTLKDYYTAGYYAVRDYTQTAYVIMSNRLGIKKYKKLLFFAGGFSLSVFDVHYYNLYQEKFNHMNAQDKIKYVYEKRAKRLNYIVTLANGQPLVFVGEWVAALNVSGATKADYQNFAKAQLDVFGKATFGWAYWTWRTEKMHYWSLKWMIDHEFIPYL